MQDGKRSFHRKKSGAKNEKSAGHRRISSDPICRRFSNFYKLLSRDPIGRGSHCSSVFKCQHRITGQVHAVKVFNRHVLKTSVEAQIKNEIEIHKLLSNASGKDESHIVKLHEYFEEENAIYIILDLAQEGDLLRNGILLQYCFDEDEARKITFQVLKALDLMHSRLIVHCDIKLDNMLRFDENIVKVCDFSLSQKISGRSKDGKLNLLTKQCGTPIYMSPEVIRRFPYGTATDLWSLGVSVYLMLAGYPPFTIEDHESKHLLAKRILKGMFAFHNEEWSHISGEAKDFIGKLLVMQPAKRMSAKDALKHPWITGMQQQVQVPVLSSTKISLPINTATDISSDANCRKVEVCLSS